MDELEYEGLLVNTIPGLEDIVAEEILTILRDKKVFIKERPYGLGGKVIAKGDVTLQDAILLMKLGRSLEKVILLIKVGEVGRSKKDLNQLYDEIYTVPFERIVTPFSRIAVRAQREGIHEYTSIDVASIVGQAVIDKIKKVYGIRPPVDLRSPTTVVYVEVIGDKFIVGIDLSKGKGLHARDYRIFVHPAALRPTIAYALLKIAGVKDNEIVLDPMCGSGTILIEAALSFKNIKLYGMDINREYLIGTRKSAVKAGVADKIILKVGDVRRLEKEFMGMKFDRIVTNPPYGIRMKPKDIKRIYLGLIKGAKTLLRNGGTLTIITTKHKLAKNIASKFKLNIIHERRIYLGGLYPHILVFTN